MNKTKVKIPLVKKEEIWVKFRREFYTFLEVLSKSLKNIVRDGLLGRGKCPGTSLTP